MLILIPVKAFAAAKSRLAPLLDAGQRARLAAWMLDRVALAARAAYPAARIVTVGDEPSCTAIVAPYGAETFPEMGEDLNASLAAALSQLRPEPATGAILVAADLPRATAADLRGLVALAERTAVLAPSHDGDGTNALWIPAGARFQPSFGPGSRGRHRQAFRAIGLSVRELRLPGLARDVDTADDLRAAAREMSDWPAALPVPDA